MVEGIDASVVFLGCVVKRPREAAFSARSAGIGPGGVRSDAPEHDPFRLNYRAFLTFCWRMIFSDLASPADPAFAAEAAASAEQAAGFAKAGNRFPLFGIMR